MLVARAVKTLLSFFLLFFLVLFFFENINALEGVRNDLIYMYFFFCIPLFFLNFSKINALKIRLSSIILIAFFIHIAINIFLNCDFKIFRPLFASTSGGIMLFYAMGFALSMFLQRVVYNNKFDGIEVLVFAIFFFFSACCVVGSLLNHFASLRPNIFLIANSEGDYQRPGDFISIFFFVLTISWLKINLLLRRFRLGRRLFYIFFSFHFTVIGLLCMVLSQLIGSNKGFLCVMVLLLVGFISEIFNHFWGKYFRKGNFSLSTIFKLCRGFLFSLIIAGIFFYGVSFLAVKIMRIDIYKMRVMNFGRSDAKIAFVGSLLSRIEIAKNNFFTHFEDSPFCGNLNVDNETTGKGTYSHSIPLYLLSHTGLIGFCLFTFFILRSFVEFSRSSMLKNSEMLFGNYFLSVTYLCCFLAIAFVGVISSNLFWSPFWFSLGVIFPPFDKAY